MSFSLIEPLIKILSNSILKLWQSQNGALLANEFTPSDPFARSSKRDYVMLTPRRQAASRKLSSASSVTIGYRSSSLAMLVPDVTRYRNR